jgi:hypothetical protein
MTDHHPAEETTLSGAGSQEPSTPAPRSSRT